MSSFSFQAGNYPSKIDFCKFPLVSALFEFWILPCRISPLEWRKRKIDADIKQIWQKTRQFKQKCPKKRQRIQEIDIDKIKSYDYIPTYWH